MGGISSGPESLGGTFQPGPYALEGFLLPPEDLLLSEISKAPTVNTRVTFQEYLGCLNDLLKIGSGMFLGSLVGGSGGGALVAHLRGFTLESITESPSDVFTQPHIMPIMLGVIFGGFVGMIGGMEVVTRLFRMRRS